jgi:hypothetical protein
VASEVRTGGKRGQNGWQARSERVAKRGQNEWSNWWTIGGVLRSESVKNVRIMALAVAHSELEEDGRLD